MNQRGFVLTAAMMMWGAIAAGAVIASLTLALYVQTVRLSNLQAEYAKFKGGVEALGRAAEKAAKDKMLKDALSKEKADAFQNRTASSLRAELKRLRDASPSRSSLPPAPAASSRPDLACFDRAEYLRADGIAIETLFGGARSLADEGTASTVGLDTAKVWVLGR